MFTQATGCTHSEFLKRKYFPELDGIRALSILLVITVHMYDKFWDLFAGELGVIIFFVISGYLITTLALREEDKLGFLSLRAFFVRRAFRLLPLYYFVLAAYGILIFAGIGADRRESFIGALPYYAFYFQEYPYFFGINGSFESIPFYQSWSLGIEEKFYLIWAALAFATLRSGTAVRVSSTMLLVVAFGLCFDPAHKSGILFPYYHILWGCLVAFLMHDPRTYQPLMFFARTLIRYTLVGSMIAIHLCIPNLPAAVMLYSPLVAFALIGLVATRCTLNRKLSHPVLTTIGRLAYGVYLVHLLCRNVVDKAIPTTAESISLRLLAYAATCGLSIAVAYVLFRIIEKPTIAMGRKLSNQLIEKSHLDRLAKGRGHFQPSITGSTLAGQPRAS